MTAEIYLYVIASGALGAFASYLFMLFSGFESLPSNVPDQSRPIVLQRIYFCFGRMIFGVTTAMILILIFFFMDSFLANELSKYKLYGYSSLAGFGTSTLSQFSKAVMPQWLTRR
jgi:ABC-type Fe3+-siderophore transport system permease subunit